jgi:CheY-like chemotaxis protein
MPKTLLLADDSVTIQKVVGISFANEDVRIVTVDNGDDAVKRAKEIRPDIVLADVVMPGKSGYEVCAALKGDPALAHIPVLLLTGTFETFDEDRAARAGADGHITKPFEAQALVELVNARLQGAAPAKSAAPAAAAPAAKAAAAEPEPFDFLEPETAAPAPARASTARPVAADTDDAFAFEAEPLEAIDLDSEEDAAVDLGNEATAARTTLLLDDEDDALSEAATAPPVRSSTAPPVRGGTTPPVRGGTTPPVRGGTAPPVRGGTAQPVGGGTGTGRPAAAPLPPAAFDDAELTTLLPPTPRATESPAAPGPLGGDPLGDLAEDESDPFASPGARPEWDVASSELDDVFGPDTTAPAPAAEPRAAAPPAPAFTTPIFDDEPGAEFELTELVPPARPAPAAAPAAAPVQAAAAAPAAPSIAELTGGMRDQVHATVEKIAWEALGDVSERIVREAVTRIEQVAWDVIPRLAETLIREEIRKLKGEE